MKNDMQILAEIGLGSRLNQISQYLMKEVQHVYDQTNIDFDSYLFPIFRIIINQEIITTCDIQERLKYTQPAITQALNKLLKKELIEFKKDEIDKRKKFFYLSQKGKEILIKLTPLWKIIEEEVRDITQYNSSNLVDHLTHFENKLEQKSLSKRILEKHNI